MPEHGMQRQYVGASSSGYAPFLPEASSMFQNYNVCGRMGCDDFLLAVSSNGLVERVFFSGPVDEGPYRPPGATAPYPSAGELDFRYDEVSSIFPHLVKRWLVDICHYTDTGTSFWPRAIERPSYARPWLRSSRGSG
jgi:hypothetical protein